jgi:tetratricopeptide (TPR) repeat protein
MTQLRISAAALIALLALAAGSGRAIADPKHKPTKAQIATAKAHFSAAQQAQAQQQWDLAADEYQAAYDAMPDPEFIYDVGEVQRLAGKRKEAIASFQKYLSLDPNGRGAPSARQSVKELQAVIAAEDAAVKAREAEAERQRSPRWTSPQRPPTTAGAGCASPASPRPASASQPRSAV